MWLGRPSGETAFRTSAGKCWPTRARSPRLAAFPAGVASLPDPARRSPPPGLSAIAESAAVPTDPPAALSDTPATRPFGQSDQLPSVCPAVAAFRLAWGCARAVPPAVDSVWCEELPEVSPERSQPLARR